MGGTAGATATLNSFDSLNGAAGTDILSAAMTGGTVSPTLTAVETLIISNTAASTAATLDLVNSSGYTTLENNGSTSDLTFANVSSAAGTFNVTNVDAKSTTFGLTTAASTGATTSTVNLSNVTGASTVAIAGVETLTLNSAGASANVLGTLTDSSLTTLKVTGSQQLTVTNALPLTTTTVDASAATGKVAVTLAAALNATVTGGSANDTLTVSAVTNNVSVNGGAGNDTIVGGSNLTATDTIDGGEGTADRLSTTIAQANALDAATPTTYNITNIEQLTISDLWSGSTTANSLLTVANIATGINTVNLAATSTTTELTTTGAVSITGPTGSFAVNLGGALISNAAVLGQALTVTDTGVATTDSVTLTNLALGGTAATDALNVFNAKNLTSTGYENVTINTGAASTDTEAQTIGTLTITPDVTAGALTTATSLTLTGANSVAITSLATTSTGTMTVDASAMTAQATGTSTFTISGTTAGTLGKFNITGTGGEDSITLGAFSATVSGGLGNDTITTGSAASSVSGGDGADNITGGSGNDTLLGGDGNDTIDTGNGANKADGGAGADTITAGIGADSILGGEGNDRIVMAGNLTNSDTVDGGAGTDTLAISSSPTATGFANVSNIEIIALTGTATLSNVISGITTFDLTDTGDQTLTLADGYTGATTVDITEMSGTAVATSSDTIDNSGADVALTVTGKEGNFATTTVITGGSGIDTLQITASSDVTYGSATLKGGTSYVSNIDVINMVASGTAAASVTVDTGDISSTGKTLTVNASALTDASATFTFDAAGLVTNATSVIVTGATAANTIKATSNGYASSSAFNVTTGAGADSIIGGSGNDVISAGDGANTITGAAGNDNLSAGSGSDTFTVRGADLTENDTISGGAGTNKLVISDGTAVADDVFANITNIQTVTSVGNALDIELNGLADAAGVATLTLLANYADTVVIGADFDNALTISLGADTVGRTDSIDATDSTATISLTSAVAAVTATSTVNVRSITTADTLIAGDSTADKITLTAYYNLANANSADSVVAFGSSVYGWETVQVNPNATYSYADISITTDSAFLADDTTAAIDATRLVDSGATLTFDGSAEAGTGAYSVVGGAGNDTISAGTGNDTIDGGAGDDSITAGAGVDNISGGSGNDTFVVATASDFTSDDETVAGGSGDDTLKFTGAATIAATDLANISSVENILFSSNNTTSITLTDAVYSANGVADLSIVQSAATTSTVTTVIATTLSAANSVNLELSDASNTASNVISLGAGNDTVTLDTDTLGYAATLAGGSGTDTLVLSGGGTATLGSKVTGFETISLYTAADDYALTTNNANVASGATLTLNGSNLTATGAHGLTFNGSAETNGYFNVTGGAGNDVITGGALSDTIVGGSGGDVITGGLGADVMTGGTGADTFFYSGTGFETGTLSPVVVYYGGTVDAGTVISTTSLDKILDFSTSDTIDTNSPLTSGTTISATSGVNGVGKAWTDPAGFLRGTYNATANTFTFSTTGSDSIFAYDNDGSTTTTDIRAIVLVGYVDSTSNDDITTGLIGTAA